MITFRNWFFAGALVALLLGIPCPAQSEITAKVDEFINTEMRRQRIPGLSLAIIRDGRPVIVKGYGFSNVEHQVPCPIGNHSQG
jgi:CubicO group peptidase (beta-lactamase class C family)